MTNTERTIEALADTIAKLRTATEKSMANWCEERGLDTDLLVGYLIRESDGDTDKAGHLMVGMMIGWELRKIITDPSFSLPITNRALRSVSRIAVQGDPRGERDR